jgi:hypothetical protein
MNKQAQKKIRNKTNKQIHKKTPGSGIIEFQF